MTGQSPFGVMHRKAAQPALATAPLGTGKPSRLQLHVHSEHKEKRQLYLKGNQVP